MDKPGTVRKSIHGDVAIRTLDGDRAPWFHVDAEGRRYWATDEDVKDWPIQPPSDDAAVF